MSNFTIKGNQQITYFTMDGSKSRNISDFAATIQEVHTVNRDGTNLSVYRPSSRINPFSTFEPGKPYIVYSKTSSPDCQFTTDGTPFYPNSVTVAPPYSSSVGAPIIFIWPASWLGNVPIAQFDEHLKVVFSPSSTGRMLRSYLPYTNSSAFTVFERGTGPMPKGYTIWAKSGFTINNSTSTVTTPTPKPTRTPTPTPTATEHELPNPIKTATPLPTLRPTATPTPTPTITSVNDRTISLNIVSRNGKTAVVEYNAEWNVPNPVWVPLNVVENNIYQNTIVVPLTRTDGFIQFRVRNIEAGGGFYTQGFDPAYSQLTPSSNENSDLFVKNNGGPGSNVTATLFLVEIRPPVTPGHPTATPYPTATHLPSPTPTRTPTPTPTAEVIDCDSYIELNIAADLPYVNDALGFIKKGTWPYGSGKTYGPWNSTKYVWIHSSNVVGVDDTLYLNQQPIDRRDGNAHNIFDGATRHIFTLPAGVPLNVNVSSWTGQYGISTTARLRLYNCPQGPFATTPLPPPPTPTIDCSTYSVLQLSAVLPYVNDPNGWERKGTWPFGRNGITVGTFPVTKYIYQHESSPVEVDDVFYINNNPIDPRDGNAHVLFNGKTTLLYTLPANTPLVLNVSSWIGQYGCNGSLRMYNCPQYFPNSDRIITFAGEDVNSFDSTNMLIL